MSEMAGGPSGGASAPAAPESCAQCGKALTPDDRVASGDRLFCRSCYATLRAELEQAVAGMSTDINYLNAAVRNPAAAEKWFGRMMMTFALVEATGLIAFVVAMIILFV